MPKTPSDCCFLVGNYVTELKGIISINSRTNFEASKVEGCIILGPSTGTVSVTSYADNKVYNGCNATASVSIPWIRKYDCDNDINYFIFQRGGMAQIAGNPADVSYLVGLNNNLFSTDYVSVSASSGPTALYQKSNQYNGTGLTYNGNPWKFNTEVEEELSISFDDFPSMFLQSFSLQFVPGQIPTASFEFVYSIDTNT